MQGWERGNLMQDRRNAVARAHAAREATVSGAFVLWIGAFALLVLSVFIANSWPAAPDTPLIPAEAGSQVD